jgi:hypothetical protein
MSAVVAGAVPHGSAVVVTRLGSRRMFASMLRWYVVLTHVSSPGTAMSPSSCDVLRVP